jgi:hypothetical protein
MGSFIFRYNGVLIENIMNFLRLFVVYLQINCISIYLSLYLSVYLFVCLSVLSVCLSACLFIYLSLLLLPLLTLGISETLRFFSAS